jgi:hypothetical protein
MRTYSIVGAFYRPPAEAILNALRVGTGLILKREPENTYDANAIAVWLPAAGLPEATREFIDSLAGYGVTGDAYAAYGDVHLGYIPREIAATIVANGLRDDAIISASFAVSPRGKPLVRVETEL